MPNCTCPTDLSALDLFKSIAEGRIVCTEHSDSATLAAQQTDAPALNDGDHLAAALLAAVTPIEGDNQ